MFLTKIFTDSKMDSKSTHKLYPHLTLCTYSNKIFFNSDNNVDNKNFYYIFKKMDGANCQINFDYETNKINCGSRNKSLNEQNDLCGFDKVGFFKKYSNDERIKKFFADEKNKNVTLYGEFIIKNVRNLYKENYNNLFLIFDVVDGDYFLDYEKYKNILDMYELDYLKPVASFSGELKNSVVNKEQDENIINHCLNLPNSALKSCNKDEGLVIKKVGNWKFDLGGSHISKIISDDWKNLAGTKKILNNENKKDNWNKNSFKLDEYKKIYCTESFIQKEFGKYVLENTIEQNDAKEFTNSITDANKILEFILSDFSNSEVVIFEGDDKEINEKLKNNLISIMKGMIIKFLRNHFQNDLLFKKIKVE